MIARLVFSFALAAGLAVMAGCGPAKLDVDKTYAMEPGDGNAVDLQPQSKAQTVTVTFESSEGEANVLIFKKDDMPTDDEIVSTPADKAMVSEKGKSGTLTAEVPPNTAVRVVVRGVSKKSDVKIHITNAK